MEQYDEAEFAAAQTKFPPKKPAKLVEEICDTKLKTQTRKLGALEERCNRFETLASTVAGLSADVLAMKDDTAMVKAKFDDELGTSREFLSVF